MTAPEPAGLIGQLTASSRHHIIRLDVLRQSSANIPDDGVVGMQVVASGYVYDPRDVPVDRRYCCFTAIARLADGTLLVTFRRGGARESVDGHVCVFASCDEGSSWEERYDGTDHRTWNGVPGEEKTLLIAETDPSELTGTILWVDRSGPPRPFVSPVTQGLLPMRICHVTSKDGGRSWHDRRLVDVTPHPGASPTGPLLRLADGMLAQPYEHWKDYDDPSPGRPAALLRLSSDGGRSWPAYVTVAADSRHARFYWDQRLAVDDETGRLVAMFWTHDSVPGRDVDIHMSWGSPDGRGWSAPVGTALPGQHCQPMSLGGERLAAVYVHRRDPPSIRVALSDDFGQSWNRETEATVYESNAGAEAGVTTSREIGEYWDDMIAWRFGHPRGICLPSGDVFVVYYAGNDHTTSVRWARLAV